MEPSASSDKPSTTKSSKTSKNVQSSTKSGSATKRGKKSTVLTVDGTTTPKSGKGKKTIAATQAPGSVRLGSITKSSKTSKSGNAVMTSGSTSTNCNEGASAAPGSTPSSKSPKSASGAAKASGSATKSKVPKSVVVASALRGQNTVVPAADSGTSSGMTSRKKSGGKRRLQSH